MKARRLYAGAAAAALSMALLAGCGGEKSVLARQAEGYEVIDEGTASGSPGVIGGQPGQPHPPIGVLPTPELTGTNLDTTTAFTTLDPVLGVPPADPNLSVGDTLGMPPPGTIGGTDPYAGAAPRPAPLRTEPGRTASTPSTTPRATSTPAASSTMEIRRSEPAPVATHTPSEGVTPTPRPTATPSATPAPTPSEEPARPEPESEPDPESASGAAADDTADEQE
jgi:hypothetical protein